MWFGKRCSAVTVILIMLGTNRSMGSKNPNEPDVRAELVEKLQRLDNLEINYETKRPQETREEPITVGDLENRLRRTYERLECSYAVSALFYLRMIDDCFFKGPPAMDLDGNIASYIMFGNEAKSMLATVHNEADLTGIEYLLWVFYMHAESLEKYIMAVTKGETVDNKKVVSADHESVSTFVEGYLRAGRCEGFDFETEFARLTKPHDTGSKEKIMTIVRVKVTLLGQMHSNDRRCGISTAGQTSISPKVLRLNDVLVSRSTIESLFERFMDRKDWERFLVKLHELYDPGTDRRLPVGTRMKSLAKFQYTFVQLLEIIMLRITWKYLKSTRTLAKLYYYGINRDEGLIVKYNKQFADELIKFCAILNLKPDSDMSVVLDLFSRPPDEFVQNSIAKKDQQTIEDVYDHISVGSYIDELLAPMCLEEYQGTKKPEIVDSICTVLISSFKHHMVKTTIDLAQIFIAFVQLTFVAVDFKVINSFINPFIYLFNVYP